MISRVKVKPPVNLADEDICDFSTIRYVLTPLKVYELSNVWITNSGICLINSEPVPESIHGYRDKTTINSLTVKLSILEDKSVIINDSQLYLLIHSPLFSYFHWFTESIPRLLHIRKRIPDLVLLLPEELKDVDFVPRSLLPFDVRNCFYIPQNTRIKVRHLVLPELKPFSSVFYPAVVEETRKLYIDRLAETSEPEGLSPYIMLENNKAVSWISVSNQADVDNIMKEYEIMKVDLLKYDFFDQVKIIHNSRLLISYTSEALGAVCFMKENACVFELLSASCYELDQFDQRFCNLASNLGLNYYYQFCSHHRYEKNIMDIELLRKNLDQIFTCISSH